MIFKKIFFLLSLPVAGFSQNKLSNQHLFDTIPFIPAHYEKRIKQFKKEPVITGRTLFLGNSITEMGEWKILLNDSTIINRGISGDITFGVLKRLDDIIVRKPSKLFIKIGINDIGKDIPDAIIADNIRKIIQRIQKESPDTKIFLQSLLPVNPAYPGFPQHYDKMEHVMNTNSLLRSMAETCSIRFVNLFPVFLDSKGLLDAQYTTDGLHLNPKGYRLWADYLKKEKLL
ncbi:MAG: GDSL-type esterase/lipase family protein [Cytophagaceae bacterium]